MPHDGAAQPPDDGVLRIDAVLGHRADPEFSIKLHRLEHDGLLDTLWLPLADMARRRMRMRSAAGRDVAIALPRAQSLCDGAVLWLTAQGALIARAETEQWLRLTPASHEAALMLGYHAGNLHWRVRFVGAALLVALEAPMETYVARLAALREGFTAEVEGPAA